MIKLDANLLSGVIAFILSFCIERIPTFKSWWEEFEGKELTIAITGMVVTGLVVGLYFLGAPIEGINEPFIWEGLFGVLKVLGSFLIASQTAYMLQVGKLQRKQTEEKV